jgi:cytochrome c-type biogenesis protein CcmH/NrfF
VSRRTRTFVVLAAAIAVVGLAALVASGGSDPTQTLDERVHEIGAGLRCPVCLNLSVADSPSKLAGEMRSEIETQLRAGRSPDQIRATGGTSCPGPCRSSACSQASRCGWCSSGVARPGSPAR